MPRVLVTGSLGFIAGHLCEMLLGRDYEVDGIDSESYAANLDLLPKLLENKNFHYWKYDVRDYKSIESLILNNYDVVFHLAACSHVDRSIESPKEFIETNIIGTFNLLEAIRLKSPDTRLVYVNTDEIFGSLGDQGIPFVEEDQLRPSSYYSSSKASAGLLCYAAYKTYGMGVVSTACTNNYGTRQFPEKLIPKVICNILSGKKVPIYGQGNQRRNWIHVEDHCRGIICASAFGFGGETYNLAGNYLMSNIELVTKICEIMEVKPRNVIEHVEDRKGHDFCYNINANKAFKELGWCPEHQSIDEDLKVIIKWYRDNEAWWKDKIK